MKSQNLVCYFDSLKLFMKSSLIRAISDEDKGYSNNRIANEFIFNNHLAFIFGLIFDQSIRSYLAWEAPYLLHKRLGHLDLIKISEISQLELKKVLTEGNKSLHRYPDNISKYLRNSCNTIISKFDSKVENIWGENNSILFAKRNLMQLAGIGEKKANLAILMLARDFNVGFSDIEDLPLSLDIHLLRVLHRSGIFALSDNKSKSCLEINKIFSIYFGGFYAASGTALWYIGRKHCHKKIPECELCPINSYCLKLL